jgi:hypothetical protein
MIKLLRIFKTRTLAKFARQNSVADASLVIAVERAMQGSIDADLGGRVIKQRVARPGQGKRGGFRLLVASIAPFFCTALRSTSGRISGMRS